MSIIRRRKLVIQEIVTYYEGCVEELKRCIPAAWIAASCRSTSSLVGGYAPENVGAASPRY